MRCKINPSQHCRERLAEAARYALFRRLAPVLRHNMAGAFQPLGMVSATLERQLKKPAPDIPAISLKSSQMNNLVREASAHCLNLMTWLAPKPNELITVAKGVEDAADLVLTQLLFKGFRVVNQTGVVQVELPGVVTQNVFLAALIALTDAATAPATVLLSAQPGDSEVVLTLAILPAQAEMLLACEPSYRNLGWEDVQALADMAAVRIVRTEDRVELHCPTNAPSIEFP